MDEQEPERWVDIKGYEGYYQVSSWGRIKSLARTVFYPNGFSRRQKDKFLSLKPSKSHGYSQVNLQGKGDPEPVLVHRLVAEYFVENDDPVNKTYVNHKFGIRTDNYYKNLEWITHQDNIQHAVDIGLYKCIGGDNHQAKSVINCRGEIFQSITEAGKSCGLSKVSRIGEVCNGKRRTAGKYPDGKLIKWKFYQEPT